MFIGHEYEKIIHSKGGGTSNYERINLQNEGDFIIDQLDVNKEVPPPEHEGPQLPQMPPMP